MSAIPLSTLATTGRWQDDFLRVLPAIQIHARIRFRQLAPQEREEAIAESVAAACLNYAQLATQGRLDRAFVSTVASFSARHVVQERHVGGRLNVRDVLSPVSQRKHGFVVRSLNNPHDFYGLKPMINDRRKFTPADAAAFRIDFANWINSHTSRDRKIIQRFISGEGTGEVADRFGVSESRISNLRRKFERSWRVFQGEVGTAALHN